jgi:hypothetical protein
MCMKKAHRQPGKLTTRLNHPKPVRSFTMAAASVAPKSFYAHLNHESGILGQHGGKVLWFSYETGRIVEVTSYAGLTVLGEAGLADCQQLMDRLHGGYAAIACARANYTHSG